MYNKLRTTLYNIASENDLMECEVDITARILTPEEAIGNTERKDFPLLQGREFLIQADFREAAGQAFTDDPRSFRGKLSEILEFGLSDNGERALFIASLNALMRSTGRADGTVHCRNQEPELCAEEMTGMIIDLFGPDATVGIVGFQPAIVNKLSSELSPDNLKVTDFDRSNINSIKYAVEVWDGREMTGELFRTCDVVLATGSTVVNDSLSQLLVLSDKYRTPVYFYGTTIAGASVSLNLKRLCFQSS